MRIHWAPDSCPDEHVQELLKIEYDFRRAVTKILLTREAEFEDEEYDDFIFNFNTLTQKFSISKKNKPFTSQLMQLAATKELKFYFED
tara:strand:+ start:139 stop:402 length:264 start_codon:yes stop_codon:yes gene_type:complete